MSKVITFSRFFQKNHPRAGEPTFFVEKLYKSLFLMKCVPSELATDFNFAIMNDENYSPKHHTIRNGNRWKVGDKFSPRVWSGKPYCSKQVIIAEDIEIKKLYDIEIFETNDIHINGKFFCSFGSENFELLAKNDGLNSRDMRNWFSKIPFKGQIIVWGKDIKY